MTVAHESMSAAGAQVQPGPLQVKAPAQRQLWSVTWFVVLCLGLGALALVPAMPRALVPFLLAIGPLFVAVAVAWREGGHAVSRLLKSAVRPPNHPSWWLVLLVPIGWALGVVLAAVALGEPSAGLFDELGPTALVIPLVVVIPAFAEELAWRGFAVPRLLSAMSPLAASLVLAVPWTALHVILQLPGGVNEGTAILPGALALFAYSVILTWVFVGSGGSVLVTALLHTGLNGVVPLMWGVDNELSWLLRGVLAAAIAAVIIGLGGLRTTDSVRDA
jgi:membrane protease YdiL (CAAX protease family)